MVMQPGPQQQQLSSLRFTTVDELCLVLFFFFFSFFPFVLFVDMLPGHANVKRALKEEEEEEEGSGDDSGAKILKK